MTKPKKTQLVPTKSPGSFGSRPLRVTFYEDRAEVTRVATVELAAGSQWIHLSGVSAFLDDRSIQVRVLTAAKSEPTDEEGDGHKAAGVAVIAASARRQVLPAYVHAKGPIEELDTQLREAELARASAQARLTRANSRRTRLRALAATWCEGLSEIPRGAATDDLAAWRAAYDSTDAALAGAMDEWFEASRALSEADDAAALAEAGELRRALRSLYLATLVSLDRRRWIAFDPHLTNWQYSRQIPGGAIRDLFRTFTRLFDHKWYGEEPTTLSDYERCRELATQIVDHGRPAA